MFDASLRRMIDPVLNRLGRGLAQTGATADGVTLVGLALGLGSAVLIAAGYPGWALIPLLAGRVADGLDGAVARATKGTDFGGYLDITCDFLFYGAVPLAFVLADPAANGAAGAFLLTSFYVNGSSFLGYAVLAEKRGLQTSARGKKALYFTGGLLEGGETIAFFIVLCLFPAWFALVSWAFGTACFFTAVMRVVLARQVFRG